MELPRVTAPLPAALTPLLARLTARGWPLLRLAELDGFSRQHGAIVAFCSDDPTRLPEVADAAVILPELLKDGGFALTPCLLHPADNPGLQAQYGVMKYPAFLFLRDGGYLGTLAGLRGWGEYQQDIQAVLARPVSRPPAIGIKVASPTSPGACA